MVKSRNIVGALLVFLVSAFVTGVNAQIASIETTASKRPVYPLKASSNNRYLVDQTNTPFLMIGDAPHALIGNVSPLAAEEYFSNRSKYGKKDLWVNLLCNEFEGCNKDATTFDGLAPFTTAGDLSTPNSAYFDRAAEIIRLAAAHDMVVLLDPIETIGWFDVLRANGVDKAFRYGQWLGNRYKT